jgi:hypothetical protein
MARNRRGASGIPLLWLVPRAGLTTASAARAVCNDGVLDPGRTAIPRSPGVCCTPGCTFDRRRRRAGRPWACATSRRRARARRRTVPRMRSRRRQPSADRPPGSATRPRPDGSAPGCPPMRWRRPTVCRPGAGPCDAPRRARARRRRPRRRRASSRSAGRPPVARRHRELHRHLDALSRDSSRRRRGLSPDGRAVRRRRTCNGSSATCPADAFLPPDRLPVGGRCAASPGAAPASPPCPRNGSRECHAGRSPRRVRRGRDVQRRVRDPSRPTRRP